MFAVLVDTSIWLEWKSRDFNPILDTSCGFRSFCLKSSHKFLIKKRSQAMCGHDQEPSVEPPVMIVSSDMDWLVRNLGWRARLREGWEGLGIIRLRWVEVWKIDELTYHWYKLPSCHFRTPWLGPELKLPTKSLPRCSAIFAFCQPSKASMLQAWIQPCYCGFPDTWGCITY